MYKQWLPCFIVGIAIILLSVYAIFSPYLLYVGVLLVLSCVVNIVVELRSPGKTDELPIGCFLGGGLIFLLTISAFFIGAGDYHVSHWGDTIHCYKDCKYKDQSNDYSVGLFNAYLMGSFDKCKTCFDKKEKEVEKERIESENERRKEKIEFIDEQIAELERVKKSLLNGEYVDISYYNFVGDMENEDEEDCFEPRRYK